MFIGFGDRIRRPLLVLADRASGWARDAREPNIINGTARPTTYGPFTQIWALLNVKIRGKKSIFKPRIFVVVVEEYRSALQLSKPENFSPWLVSKVVSSIYIFFIKLIIW